ncbi:hypothetical protein AX761_06165 [Rhizobium sp. 58]|nr:hypothetical protein AX761_06165 [Rhizobium sp. 58]
MNYIDVRSLANLASVSRQAIEKSIKSIVDGRAEAWRGHVLEIRTAHGRGGRSGIQYQIKVSSLPVDIQDRLKAIQIADEAVSSLRFGSDAQFERAWKHEVIKAALSHPKGSGDRKIEIERLHGATRLDWTGHQRKLTRTTLYDWIKTYECEGIHGLAQRVRSDKGEKKVIISRAWCNSVGFNDATKDAVEESMKQFVRAKIKMGTTLKILLILAGQELKRLTIAHKDLAPIASMDDSVFVIPRSFVEAEAGFKAVYRHRFDRKASEDNKPRIQRTIAGLQPMEIVVMDVHHINVHVGRDDGTYSTAKLLAFYDIATARVFCEIIQFDERGGVRNADVIQAFVNMCEHAAFGMPQYLYADNGSEYRFADMLEDALKLGSTVVPYEGREGLGRVLRAKAYNAAAKHVEGWFRQMNRQYFRHIQGWRDDDAINPKRPQLGKLHKPYAEGFDAVCEEVFGLLTAYENIPQKGGLKGKSPALTFKAYVDAGWKATLLNPHDLLTVFTQPETRVVEKHGFSVKGMRWTCDGLLEYFGRTVLVHIPKFHSFGELLVTDANGNTIGVAVADREYHVLDPRGAQESARRDKVRKSKLREMDRSVADVDVGAELIAFGRNAAPVVPNQPDAMISVNRVGSGRLALPPVPVSKTSRQHQDDELRNANNDAIAKLNEIFAIGGKR